MNEEEKRQWKYNILEAICIEEDTKKGVDILYGEAEFPRKIYKYRPGISYNADGELYDVISLRENNIWASAANKFNDPFDSAILLNFKDFLRPDKTKLKEVLNFKKGIKEISDLSDTIRSHTYVSCFSELVDSRLMWSHYACNHRGFCIEYDLVELMGIGTVVLPVNYTDTVFPVEGFQNKYIQLFTLTKHIDWEYEKEWRYFSYDLEHQKPLPGKATNSVKPSAIYLGCKINENKDLEKELRIEREVDYRRSLIASLSFCRNKHQINTKEPKSLPFQPSISPIKKA